MAGQLTCGLGACPFGLHEDVAEDDGDEGALLTLVVALEMAYNYLRANRFDVADASEAHQCRQRPVVGPFAAVVVDPEGPPFDVGALAPVA